jgi:molybdopterin synthase catalytic subunit
VRLTRDPLPPWAPETPRPDAGAELVFHGRVRDAEEGVPVTAIEYEAYEPMALAELRALADELLRRFPVHDLECIHRVGVVPVGEASLRVVLRSAHRTEAIEALVWFVRELKVRVPIWKWGITAEGRRFASHTRSAGPDGAP